MKRKAILIMMVLTYLVSYELKAQSIKISDTITSVEKFLEIRDKIATTPEGGAAMFLLALKVYSDNPKLGKQCLVIAADQANLQKGDVYMDYELMPLEMKMIKMAVIDKNRRLPNSYIKGATPENNYSVKLPYIFEFPENLTGKTEEDGATKLFVKCYGDAMNRPISVKKNNRGLWKAYDWKSILNGIKKPPFDDKL
ncbi:MAG: hypothetical protein U0W24_23465 [Bacteroidales bacterium]